MNTAPVSASAFVKVTHTCGASLTVPRANAWEAADQLIAAHGPCIPCIESCEDPAPLHLVSTPPASSAPSRDRDTEEWIDHKALARIERDRETARRAGFSMGVEAYARGTVVNSTGVENARKARAEFEALPLAREGLQSLVARVQSENRRDERVSLSSLRMADDGRVGTLGVGPLWSVERDGAIGAIATAIANGQREGAPRPAGLPSYLASCPADLRARNLNAWAEAADVEATAVLRTREGSDGKRGVFAVVSEQYSAVDTDRIARIVSEAIEGMPGELRTRIAYDGRRAQIDVIAHSNVEAESYAAGEVFRAFARISTDDTGGGSIQGHGGIDQNLCRNLIILHHAKAAGFRVIHKGSEHTIVREVRKGIAAALASVAAFGPQWSRACSESILPDMTDVQIAQASDRLLAELFAASLAGAVSREAITAGNGTVAARVKSVVPDLVRMWADDCQDGSAAVQRHGGLTRAAVANATTRYAHKVVRNAFGADSMERDGGRILAGVDTLAAPTAMQWKAWGTSPAELVRESRAF